MWYWLEKSNAVLCTIVWCILKSSKLTILQLIYCVCVCSIWLILYYLTKKKALFAPFFDRKYLIVWDSMLKQIQQKIDPFEI